MKRYIHLGCELFLIDQGADLFPNWTVFAFFPHFFLHFDQVVLLRAEDGARSYYSNPANKSSSWEVIVFHRVTGNQGTRSSQASFAVNSYGSFGVLGKINKLVHDVH